MEAQCVNLVPFLRLVVSISCTVIMVLLFISSFSEYLSSVTTSQMLIDDSPSEMKLKIAFNIDFTKVPCSLITIDNQDLLGFAAVIDNVRIMIRKMYRRT